MVAVFPNATIQYCLFHYDGCLSRAIKRLKVRHVRAEPEFRTMMQGLRDVPFLPHDEARRGAAEVLIGRFTPFYNAQTNLTKAKLRSG